MLDGDFVEFHQPLRLGDARLLAATSLRSCARSPCSLRGFPPKRVAFLRRILIDHDGVDVLHVGDADELVDGGVVALVAFELRVRGLPLLVRHAEKRDIENIRLACVDDVHL